LIFGKAKRENSEEKNGDETEAIMKKEMMFTVLLCNLLSSLPFSLFLLLFPSKCMAFASLYFCLWILFERA
jgi:hypothetical protein